MTVKFQTHSRSKYLRKGQSLNGCVEQSCISLCSEETNFIFVGVFVYTSMCPSYLHLPDAPTHSILSILRFLNLEVGEASKASYNFFWKLFCDMLGSSLRNQRDDQTGFIFLYGEVCVQEHRHPFLRLNFGSRRRMIPQETREEK